MVRIYTETEWLDVDPNNIDDLIKAMEFKGVNITAKAQPELFMVVAKELRKLQNIYRYAKEGRN